MLVLNSEILSKSKVLNPFQGILNFLAIPNILLSLSKYYRRSKGISVSFSRPYGRNSRRPRLDLANSIVTLCRQEQRRL